MKMSTLSSSHVYLFKCSNLTNPTTISPFLIPTKPKSHLKYHTHLPISSQSLNNLKNPYKSENPILEVIPNCQKNQALTNGYQRFVPKSSKIIQNLKNPKNSMLEFIPNCQKNQLLPNGYQRFVPNPKESQEPMLEFIPSCHKNQVLPNRYQRFVPNPKELERPMLEFLQKCQEIEVLPNGYQRFVVMGAVCAGILLFMVGIDGEKAMAMGPEGPLVEEFWDNVRRYALYALTVSTGAIYTILVPIIELLKNPISAILLLVILGGGFYIVTQVVSAMVGITDFSYEYSY